MARERKKLRPEPTSHVNDECHSAHDRVGLRCAKPTYALATEIAVAEELRQEGFAVWQN